MYSNIIFISVKYNNYKIINRIDWCKTKTKMYNSLLLKVSLTKWRNKN
jgi:hypothetical protein